MKNAYLKYIYVHPENLTNIAISLTIKDDYPLPTYISRLYITFLNELHNQNTSKEQNYSYNKIDLQFLSINQDLYQSKLFTFISYTSLNVKEHL